MLAGSLAGLALAALLLLERALYGVPLSLTWRVGGHGGGGGREVVGVPLRYGEETGRPKISRQVRSPAGAGVGVVDGAVECD